MTTKKKTATPTAQDIIDHYSTYLLEQGSRPTSVYQFCKEINIEESEFYKHFASFEMIEAAFFVALHEHSMCLLEKNEAYASYDNANKLLSYYFTFFEMATANRSYILMSLKGNKNPLASLTQLKELRTHFLAFANTITSTQSMMPDEKLKKMEGKILQEGAWLQFLFTLNFWIKDTSPSFEKTDVLIEKSVRANFDVMENIPMKSLVDLGKFLWKESPFK
jgi:AcrR family transcriptional regulator